MIISRSIAVLSTCLAGVYAHAIANPAPAAITAAPVIARQATAQGFVGYYSSSGALACEFAPKWQLREILIILKGVLRNVCRAEHSRLLHRTEFVAIPR
jgi:hypothetical protein